MAWSDSTPVLTTFHPLLPAPFGEQPATPFAHGTEKTKLGIRFFPDPMMGKSLEIRPDSRLRV